LLLGFGRELGSRDALAQLVDLVVLPTLAELLPDALHVLAQRVLALRAAELGLHDVGDAILRLQHFQLALDHGEHELHAAAHLERFEDALTHGDPGLFFRKVRGDEIREGARFAHVVEDAGRLFRQVGHQRQHLTRALAQALPEIGQPFTRVRRLGHTLHFGAHVRLETVWRGQTEPPESVQHHAVVRGTEADHLHDAGERAHLVEVVERGFDGLGTSLCDDAHEGAVIANQILDQAYGPRASDVDRHHRHREQHRVPEREDRDALRAGSPFRRAHVTHSSTADDKVQQRSDLVETAPNVATLVPLC
jgi:hypothetical protein